MKASHAMKAAAKVRSQNMSTADTVTSMNTVNAAVVATVAAAVVGNSSSGVVETPSFGVPAVNIGRRQAGRAICENVVCCEGDAAAIEAAIRKALSPAFAAKAKTARSPAKKAFPKKAASGCPSLTNTASTSYYQPISTAIATAAISAISSAMLQVRCTS